MSIHDESSGQANSGQANSGQANSGQPNNEHFDEIDAVRRFPSEDTWLDLPMPNLQDDSPEARSPEAPSPEAATQAAASPEAATSQAATPTAPSNNTSFADRVMQARQEELELDSQIAELDQALPNDLLQQFGVPAPSDSFVDKTVQKITTERRQRWQKILSRHVAPEPSAKFVSRTLAALQDGSNAAAGGKQIAARTQLQAPPGGLAGRRQNWPVFGLVAAAAAALVWVALTGDIRQPLEIRLSDQASPAVAYASSTSPMSAILAQVAEDEEPFAMFSEPADGLWLVSDSSDSEELR